ncbi:4Fe-4S binding protein [uncultured Dysosmobacter sp.]|uniref:4Fe-4S binding protein n=1 Tax=uncultured Dysosmobacter sp. TaxID=2591384 RepID=UPI00260499AB|nr:4Fe-4S binding protein [uncultured Dysosmobacter sp.]
MEIKKVWALYYSAIGTTNRTVNTIAEELAAKLDLPLEPVGFTRPVDREKGYCFTENDLVVVGTPTYAGRVPNKILPDFREKLKGGGALAVPVVLFGNRSYDNALAELCAVLEAAGFHTVAAGAFVGQHAFTDKLAGGRPDWEDRRQMQRFAGEIADKVKNLTEIPAPVKVPGDPDAPYYVPKGLDGEPAKFLKAKPRTDLSRCCNCGACARLCPMGAIDPNNVANVPGICIKCQRCVRKCTHGAKYFDDPAFLSHVAMLEANFQKPKKNEVFL